MAALAVSVLMLATSAGPAAAIAPPNPNPSALVQQFPSGPPQVTEQKSLCGKLSASSSSDVKQPSAASKLLNLPAASRYSTGSGVKVATIGTGVQPSNRFKRLSPGGDFVSSGDGLKDCDGFGTMAAGIIAARPSPADGVVGIAPDAELLAIRQTSSAFAAKDDKSASRSPMAMSTYGDVQTLAYAVVSAVRQGADVIHIGGVSCAGPNASLNDAALGAALQYAHRRNVVVVAPAGNLIEECGNQNTGVNPADPEQNGWDALNTVVSPGWYSRYVLTVGGVESTTGTPWEKSMHGPWVAVAAPATELTSIGFGGDAVNRQEGKDTPTTVNDTGYAAAYVAGLAALIKSRFPDLGADAVMRRITATAHGSGSGRDHTIGYGVIDPVAALSDTVAAAPGAPGDTTHPIAAPDADEGMSMARKVGVIGTAVCLLAALTAWMITIPRRRLQKLTEDDY